MGLPKSFFPLLHNLRREDQYTEQARAAVEPFSLFAFIIGRPDGTDGLRKEVEEHFLHLHQATGERLLFFTPIDEPEGWRESMEASLGDNVLQLYETIPEKLRSKDPLRSEQIFASALGIASAELPVLVVSEDLGSPEYFVIRSSRDTVRGQLAALGNLALDLDRQGGGLCLKHLSTPEIDSCSGLHGADLVEPLAGLLHDALSIILAANFSRRDLSSSFARSSLIERCHELRTRLDCFHPARYVGVAEEDEPMPEIVRSLESLACLLAGLVDNQSNAKEVCWPFQGMLTEASFPGWEMESRSWWETGNRVCHQIQVGCEEPDQPEGGFLWDWSAAVVSWAKSVENELNLSAAHWIRRDLGVELPPFFNRYQPSLEAIFNPSGNYSLNFNRPLHEDDTGSLWRPPPLGPLIGVLNHYSLRGQLNWLCASKLEPLYRCLETVRTVRNSACHPRWVGRESAGDLLAAVAEMQELGIFREMASLKTNLQKNTEAPAELRIWIARAGIRYGPYSEAQARDYLMHGRLLASDHAWTCGMSEWGVLANLLKK